MSQQDESSKLHVDADWKAQAQAEKERLADASDKAAADRGERGGPGELPAADFRGLLGALASQAILGLGAIPDPKTGRVYVDLQGARFAIDLLGVLEEKTKGNLEADEAKELAQLAAELRARFVQISNLIAQQSAAAAPQPGEKTAAPSKLVEP